MRWSVSAPPGSFIAGSGGPPRTEVRVRYYSAVLSSHGFVQEMRLFDLGTLFVERFRALRHRLRTERRQLAVRRLSAELATQVSAMVAMYLAYGFVAYQALTGAITLVIS